MGLRKRPTTLNAMDETGSTWDAGLGSA